VLTTGEIAVAEGMMRVASTLRTAVAVGLVSTRMISATLLHAVVIMRSAATKMVSLAPARFTIFPKFIPNLIWDKFGISISRLLSAFSI